ncbi:MAG: hypothetical protein PHH49_03080 [Candidatus Omnitrophica bacterium]|nr:hypothetical protein [Patescibacteria group bacterium]MDD5487934.1 hypothetical protein [Candidatus Omnitrophota bacterium]
MNAFTFSGFTRHIDLKVVGSPYTFEKYTLNSRGAIYGRAATKEQIKRRISPQILVFKNSIFAGHWTTSGLGQTGIPVVALSGKAAAKTILSLIAGE